MRFALVIWLVAGAISPPAAGSSLFRLEPEQPWAGIVRQALDVRVMDEGRILLAVGRNGLVECSWGRFQDCRTIISGGNEASDKRLPRFDFTSLAAASGRYAAVGSGFGAVAVLDRQAGAFKTISFAAPIDMDAGGGSLVILGSQRTNGQWAPDGGIAWFGNLENGLAGVKPILFSSTSSNAKSIGYCGQLLTGGVRFFPNGSFVVVPGVDPGIFLFDALGRLIRTWETDGLGFLDRCPLDDAQARSLGSLEPRMAWINRNRVIDEVLSLDQGPAVIVRTVAGGVVSWEVVLFLFNGRIQRERLPFSSKSGFTRLRADRKGSRVVFLLTEHTSDPPARQRLIRGEVDSRSIRP